MFFLLLSFISDIKPESNRAKQQIKNKRIIIEELWRVPAWDFPSWKPWQEFYFRSQFMIRVTSFIVDLWYFLLSCLMSFGSERLVRSQSMNPWTSLDERVPLSGPNEIFKFQIGKFLWNKNEENELFVPFKFVDNKCCGIMDERMKRKYTEMIFHFFQEYFPGTRIYEGKCTKNLKMSINHSPCIIFTWVSNMTLVDSKSRTKEPQKQFRPRRNQTEPNFFLLVRHFYYSNAVNLRWLRWLIIVMNDLILSRSEFNIAIFDALKRSCGIDWRSSWKFHQSQGFTDFLTHID